MARRPEPDQSTEGQAPGRWLSHEPLSQLRPNPANPRTHKPAELRRSFDRFGFTNPVLIDERTGMIAAGHGRYELLTLLFKEKAEPPDGVIVGPDGEWLVPVSRGWASRDDDEAEAYLIADNRQTELGGWDDAGLAELLAPLTAEGAQGLLGTGFSLKDYEGLLVAPEEEKATSAIENSYGERADRYRNKDVRSIIFDYPLADYDFVLRTAKRALATYNVTTTAELWVALLERFDKEHPEAAA